ncbi:hypothetical protein QYE76_040462 [Lolium multiflorum]|uniref:CCHC-type domain-containing protein n=1 Tax=Lolium multiflorum TaxID=4521 RepID=A0AAD8TBL6_LOLMU|nr:hypothetical protein QYE76_040462 [Lolium multiflorum]
MLSTYLWSARSMPFSRVILLLMSSTLRVLLFELDSLRTAVCATVPSSDVRGSGVSALEFLSRLRKEFEPRRAQLLARGRVPLSEVLAELRAEETRLRGAGLLEVPSVLAARGPPVPSARGPPMPPASLRPPAQPILPTPPFQGQRQPQQPRGSTSPPCTYCGRPGHTISTCWQRDSFTPGSSSAQAILLFRAAYIMWSSLPGLLPRAVCSSSGITRPPPSTQSEILVRKYSQLDEINAQSYFCTKLPEDRGKEVGPRGAATTGGAALGLGAALVCGALVAPALPFRLLKASVVKPPIESHDTENLPDAAAANPISGIQIASGTLPERGIISGGLFIAMIASGMMSE